MEPSIFRYQACSRVSRCATLGIAFSRTSSTRSAKMNSISARRFGQIAQVLLVCLRKDYALDAGAARGEHLLLHAADRQDQAGQRDLARHGRVVASRHSSSRAEASAVAMVTPAEGPSFGMAPAGTWMCTPLFLKTAGSIPSSSACDQT